MKEDEPKKGRNPNKWRDSALRGGGKVLILHINVTIRDSGWRLTVQEVLLI
jgi:hypothetical protein